MECTCANVDDIAHYTSRPYGVANYSYVTGQYSRLLCKQHDSKSSTRENDSVKRCSKHEMYEAAAGMTWCTVLLQIFLVSRKSLLSNNDKTVV